MQCVGQQCVIVVFPDHTFINILTKRLWRASHVFLHGHTLNLLGCSEVKKRVSHFKPNNVSPICLKFVHLTQLVFL